MTFIQTDKRDAQHTQPSTLPQSTQFITVDSNRRSSIPFEHFATRSHSSPSSSISTLDGTSMNDERSRDTAQCQNPHVTERLDTMDVAAAASIHAHSNTSRRVTSDRVRDMTGETRRPSSTTSREEQIHRTIVDLSELYPLMSHFKNVSVPLHAIFEASEFIEQEWELLQPAKSHEQAIATTRPKLSHFLASIHRRIPTNYITLITSLIYIHRLKQHYPSSKGEPGCGCRLSLVSYMIASRLLCDPGCCRLSNAMWSGLAGNTFSQHELSRMESEFCHFLSIKNNALQITRAELIDFVYWTGIGWKAQTVPGSDDFSLLHTFASGPFLSSMKMNVEISAASSCRNGARLLRPLAYPNPVKNEEDAVDDCQVPCLAVIETIPK